MNTGEFIAELDRQGFSPVKVAGGWKARCPGHNGDGQSLSITEGDDGRTLLTCFAHHCAHDDITSRMGLKTPDLFDKPLPSHSIKESGPRAQRSPSLGPGCVQKRRLYTNKNTETVTLRSNARLGITTANPTFASDAGQADRLLIVRMRRREGETKDSTLTEQVKAARDAGLSHIALILGRALADRASVPPGLNERHQDFAAFAVRIGRALGREAETVALQSAESDKAAFCIENDPVGAGIMAIVNRNGALEGKAAEIGPMLASVDQELHWATAAPACERKDGGQPYQPRMASGAV